MAGGQVGLGCRPDDSSQNPGEDDLGVPAVQVQTFGAAINELPPRKTEVRR